MDVVYFLTETTFYGHRELLYSLRSLEKHLAGWDRVFVVGAAPAWTGQNFIHIGAADPFTRNKDANIIRKMLCVCDHCPEIGDPFLFVNDDHFFSRDAEAAAWPNYHKGELPEKTGGLGSYAARLRNTREGLLARGLPTRNFDVHTPIIIHKRPFLDIFASWDWLDLDGPGIVMKSVYVNSMPELAAAGEYLRDLKITMKSAAGSVESWQARLAERPCWSTGENVPPGIWEVLASMYPEKSRFEV